MSVLAKPHTFSPNTSISSSQMNANFDTLYNDYNGNITSANLASNSVVTSKIADLNVTTQKLAAASVTADKLAEAFFRGRQQAITTNTAPTGLTVQFGWGFIATGGTNSAATTVTFPTAFSSPPIIFCSVIATKNGSDPTSVDDFATGNSRSMTPVSPESITASSFSARIRAHDTGAFTSGDRVGFTWLALGAV